MLPKEEAMHCFRVLRRNPGDKIDVVDGVGGLFHCLIVDKSGNLELLERFENWGKPSRRIHLAVAPTKNSDRMEWLVEKAVEVGVSEITFVLCQNSERRKLRTDRMEKIAISAMKQSLKAYLPKINALTNLDSFLVNQKSGTRIMAHLSKDSLDTRNLSISDDVVLLVGPEGDFTPEEVGIVVSSGFKVVHLGKNRLRTETAALAGVVILNSIV